MLHQDIQNGNTVESYAVRWIVSLLMTLSDLYTAMKDESVILIEQLQWMTHVWSDLLPVHNIPIDIFVFFLCYNFMSIIIHMFVLFSPRAAIS